MGLEGGEAEVEWASTCSGDGKGALYHLSMNHPPKREKQVISATGLTVLTCTSLVYIRKYIELVQQVSLYILHVHDSYDSGEGREGNVSPELRSLACEGKSYRSL